MVVMKRFCMMLVLVAAGVIASAQAPQPLPAEDLAKFKLTLRLSKVTSEQPDPNTTRLEVGAFLQNNTDWEIVSVEIKYQFVKGGGRSDLRGTCTRFVDHVSGLAGNLLPHCSSWATTNVSIPLSDTRNAYWVEITGANGYRQPAQGCFAGGLFAEMMRGNGASAVKMIKEAPARADYRGNVSDNQTVHIAAQAGSVEVLQYLASTGSNLGEPNKKGLQPIHLAAKSNKPEAVRFLLQNGATVKDLSSTGLTPLLAAANGNAYQSLELLMRAGSDVEAVSNNGSNVLHWLAWGHDECPAPVLQALLSHTRLINQQNKSRSTPLHLAAYSNDPLLAAALIRARASLEILENGDDTPLHDAAREGSKEVAALLIQNRANVNAVNAKGATPLMIAAQQGVDEIVDMLITARAKVDASNPDGYTAMHVAAAQGQHAICTALAKAGASVNSQSTLGLTPLMMATEKRPTTVATLLQLGAKPDLVDSEGSTALHHAVRFGNLKSVEALLNAGASRNLKDGAGRTPADIAQQLGRRTIYKLITSS
jgi:ankyrin repeat protein